MKTKKRFTNTTFTKRVDHDGGAHRTARSIKEPAMCSQCGAVYVNRRWSKQEVGSALGNEKDLRPSQMVVCPACKQQKVGEPRGFVFLDGEFFVAHQDEIERLLQNEAERAADDNVLARIMDWKRGNDHNLSVTTTTEHLAQRLGHALQKAFSGEVQYDFSHENKLARVKWQRD